MSPHVIPLGTYELIERFLYDDSVDTRLQYVLSTFPPDKSRLPDWRQFEARRYTRDWCMPAAAIDTNKFYFFITHVWLDSRDFDHVISLTNCQKFRALNTLVGKHPGFDDNYKQLKQVHWPDYPVVPGHIPDHMLDMISMSLEFQSECQGNMLLDVDSTMFNKTEFLGCIENFANKIGIEDLDLAAVEQVYDVYIQLHQ